MHHRSIRMTSLVSTILLAWSASPAPAEIVDPSPAPAPITFPPSNLTGTLFPRFATRLVNRSLVDSLRTAAGDTRPLLSWDRCPVLGTNGLPKGGFYDHCVAFTVGTSRSLTAYTLTDIACPAGNAASAC